jgi:hypothetical protein
MPRNGPVQRKRGYPRASWCSGATIEHGAGEGGRFIGWYVDTDLDPEFDAAAEAAGWQVGALEHQGGRMSEHWLLPNPVEVYPMVDSLPRYDDGTLVAGYQKDRQPNYLSNGEVAVTAFVLYAWTRMDIWNYGIGARWPKGQKSGMSMDVLFKDLAIQGYLVPTSMGIRSNGSDDLVNALLRHHKVVVAARLHFGNRFTERFGREIEFSDLSLPLGNGEKTVRTQRESGEKRAVFPIKDGHPDPILPHPGEEEQALLHDEFAQYTSEYVKTCFAPKGLDPYEVFKVFFDENPYLPMGRETIIAKMHRYTVEPYNEIASDQRSPDVPDVPQEPDRVPTRREGALRS